MFVKYKKGQNLKRKEETSINHSQKGSTWEKKIYTLDSCSLVSLISCSCTIMAHSNLLLQQAKGQQVKYHYNQSRISENCPLRMPPTHFLLTLNQPKKKKNDLTSLSHSRDKIKWITGRLEQDSGTHQV